MIHSPFTSMTLCRCDAMTQQNFNKFCWTQVAMAVITVTHCMIKIFEQVVL